MSRNKKTVKAILEKKEEIEFLRNFDLLTAVNEDEKKLYESADLIRGEEIMQANCALDDDECRFSLNCDIDKFRKFGPGIYLLFKFLKFATLIFGLAGILSIVNIGILSSNQTELTHQQRNGFKNFILRTTLQNVQVQHFDVIVGINITILVILLAGMIFWSERQSKYIYDCLKQNSLASYYTVILSKLPENYNEVDMKNYMESHYGPVTEIYTVRDFGEDILEYKEMNEIVKQYKEEIALMKLDQDETRKSNRMTRLFLEFRNGHRKIKQKIKDASHYKSCFAFIQFRRAEDREKLLTTNKFLKCLTSCFSKKQEEITSPQSSINSYQSANLIFEECQMEPNGIIWENLHLLKSQKITKTCFLLFLMSIVLVLSVLFISLLSSVQMSVNNTIFSSMSKKQIIQTNDEYALLIYCLSLSYDQFKSKDKVCGKFNNDYLKIAFLVLLIPLSISLIKFLLTELMKLLVHFRRYDYQIRRIQSQAVIIFFFYFLVTGIIQLIVYLSFGSHASLFNLFTPFIQFILDDKFSPDKLILSQDYTPNWYILAAYNVVLIGIISFNLSALGIIFYCFIRKKIGYYMAKKQKIQVRMNNWLKGYTLQIEYIYASVLTIIYFTMLFAANMPILYPLAFISFFIQYWAYKYIFVRFCAKPPVFNHSVSRMSRKFVLGALIMHCFITPTFFKAEGIAKFQEKLGFFERIFRMGYYFGFAIVIIAYMTLRNPIQHLIIRLKNSYTKKKSQMSEKSEKDSEPKDIFIARKKSSLPPQIRSVSDQHQHQSYSMHESPRLKKTLLTLYTINNRQRTRKTCLLNRELFHLYNGSNDMPAFRGLFEVIKKVQRDFKKHQEQFGKNRNPYESPKRKLYQIYLHCKEDKMSKFTLNQINYYNQLDFVCQRLSHQNQTNQSLKVVDNEIEHRKSEELERVIQVNDEESQNQSSQASKLKNKDKQFDHQVILPPESENRLYIDNNNDQ